MKKTLYNSGAAVMGGAVMLAGCQSVTAFVHAGGTMAFVLLLVAVVLYAALRQRRQ